MQSRAKLPFLFVVPAMLAPQALGGEPDPRPTVAIVAAATTTNDPYTSDRFTDPRDKLLSTGLFAEVELWNATDRGPNNGVPTPDDFARWDAVLVWSNMSFGDAAALGTALADYVDGGGGVVVAIFANTSTNPARFLQGRWLSDEGYIAIPQGGGYSEGPGELGDILIPDHPIFEGVDTFVTRWGTTSTGLIFGGYRPTNTSVTPGSEIVAEWNTGHTLVALAPNPRVVELGFHPVSSDVAENAYWDASSDGARLMANALLFAMGEGATCPGDATGDGVVNFSDLNIVLNNFGGEGEGLPGDVTGDGRVDFADLNLILNNFATEC